MNQLDAFKQLTTVVADTGDFHQMVQYQPRDATTNPSLILKAVQKPAYAPLLRTPWRHTEASRWMSDGPAAGALRHRDPVHHSRPGLDRSRCAVVVRRGRHLRRAERLIALYRAAGVPAERVLIKVSSTWEGIRAAERLEQRGIRCNMTLLFSFCQAVASGQAGAQLISPFVGRIYDWYKKAAGPSWDEAAMAGANDPGVQSVTRIFNYYKRHGITTEVMGASFRNIGQIRALAGCDLLTISPELLAQLAASDDALPRALDAEAARALDLPEVHYDEPAFRLALNQDAMATEKLAEGIRAFIADAEKLEALMQTA